MSWRQRLRPALFRGVRFHVDDRKYDTGRRIHNHEYPKRDENFPEDMGRKTCHWQLTAYLVGDDYITDRDRLVAACERPGAGTLVDFWMRSHQVACEDWSGHRNAPGRPRLPPGIEIHGRRIGAISARHSSGRRPDHRRRTGTVGGRRHRAVRADLSSVAVARRAPHQPGRLARRRRQTPIGAISGSVRVAFGVDSRPITLARVSASATVRLA